MNRLINQCNRVKGELNVPGDKSISHRALMLGSIAEGQTTITGLLKSYDCMNTLKCMQMLGVEISENESASEIYVSGRGLHGLTKPEGVLDVGNSGTSIRLLSGILSAQAFDSVLTGDESIRRRPMDRIMEPLKLMGAKIDKTDGMLHIEGGHKLHGIEYTCPVASAQLKSAIILAGLYADSPTVINEPLQTRTHTEIMLNYLGGSIKTDSNHTVTCYPAKKLEARHINVPGDISSAAFFMAAALVRPNSSVTIHNVGVNPLRTGIITVLQQMGADVRLANIRTGGEQTSSIVVNYSKLKACTVGGAIIPRLIDELPIIAVLACIAEGTTIIKDAAELKVKETNRINAMCAELKKLGAHIEETSDGMIIEGGYPLHGTVVKSYDDHRIAMSLAIAGLFTNGSVTINNADCVNISFPGFFDTLDSVLSF